MAVETVRIAVLKDVLPPVPLNGVLVRVFDQAGDIVTSASSGVLVPGQAELELDGSAPGTIYTLRFYLAGAAIAPKRIQVYSPPEAAPGDNDSNDFVVMAEVFELAPAPDPRKCRVSGIVLGPTGTPRAGVDIAITPKFYAFVDTARAVLTGRFVVRTDADGFATVDLYRHGMYEIVVHGEEPLERMVTVPNKSAIVIGHLLFPVVVYVGYLEAAPYTMAVRQTLYLTPTVRASDYRNLGVGAEDVLYSVADPTIASVQVSGDRIAVRGLRAGTTSLRVTRLDRSIVYVPDLGIAGGDVPIVVTEA